MSFTKAKSKKLIKGLFLSGIEGVGFSSAESGLGGYRVRGQLIDSILIQIGRSPGSYYLHYFTNHIADPFCNILNANNWGKRLSGVEQGDSWYSESEHEAEKNLEKIIHVAKNKCSPELEAIKEEKDLACVFEGAFEAKAKPLSLALIYACCGEREKSITVLRDSEEAISGSEYLDADEKQRLLNLSGKLADAVNNNLEKQLFNSWKSENISKYMLKINV